MKSVGYLSLIIILISCMACAKEKETKIGAKSAANKDPASVKIEKDQIMKSPFHGKVNTDPMTEVIAALKKAKLNVDANKTIGEAFDSFRHASKKEWRGALGVNGAYIDFICRIDVSPFSAANVKDDIVMRFLDVKFAIHEGRETYVTMVSRTDLKKDGSQSTVHYEPVDREKIVKAIYANQEIPF